MLYCEMDRGLVHATIVSEGADFGWDAVTVAEEDLETWSMGVPTRKVTSPCWRGAQANSPRIATRRLSHPAGRRRPRGPLRPNPQSYSAALATSPESQPEDFRIPRDAGAPRDLCAPTRKVTTRRWRGAGERAQSRNPKTFASPPAPASPGTSAPQPAKLQRGAGEAQATSPRVATRRLSRPAGRRRPAGPVRPNPQSYSESTGAALVRASRTTLPRGAPCVPRAKSEGAHQNRFPIKGRERLQSGRLRVVIHANSRGGGQHHQPCEEAKTPAGRSRFVPRSPLNPPE